VFIEQWFELFLSQFSNRISLIHVHVSLATLEQVLVTHGRRETMRKGASFGDPADDELM
jgi:hypothetical protein